MINAIFGVPLNKSNTHQTQLNKPKKPNSIMAENLAVKEAERLSKERVKEIGMKYLEISQFKYGQWCADAVNYFYLKGYGKTPFGVDKNGRYLSANVQGLINWGKSKMRYHGINSEREIPSQLKEMHSGDVIIFKSPYTVKVEGGKTITRHASHTGIIKEVKDGKIITIEGNANIYKVNSKGERLLVHNDKEGENGNQAIGDFQEVNHFDSILEKFYTVNDLIENGYSGYIDMQNLKF